MVQARLQIWSVWFQIQSYFLHTNSPDCTTFEAKEMARKVLTSMFPSSDLFERKLTLSPPQNSRWRPKDWVKENTAGRGPSQRRPSSANKLNMDVIELHCTFRFSEGDILKFCPRFFKTNMAVSAQGYALLFKCTQVSIPAKQLVIEQTRIGLTSDHHLEKEVLPVCP